MKTLTLLSIAFAIASALSLPAFAQNQATYQVKAVQGAYMLIGEKPYKILGDCGSFQAGDTITFSEDPITCLKVTAIDIESLDKCELECIENLGTPDPVDNPAPNPN